MTTRFSDLTVGEIFEFDHRDFSCLSIMHGPFRKTGRKTYEHQNNRRNSSEYTVGLPTARVLRGESCKGEK